MMLLKRVMGKVALQPCMTLQETFSTLFPKLTSVQRLLPHLRPGT